MLAVGVAGAAGTAGVEASAAGGADAPAALPHGLIELKRQATARGTPDETTKTNLKFDFFPQHDVVALVRVELPFPDATSSFSGSIFDPEFGDAKLRVGFRAFDMRTTTVTSFVELIFPTADPPTQGTGKYQLSVGVKPAFALGRGPTWLGSPAQSASIQVQQVFSFAGDESRRAINQTKFELEWRETWPTHHYAKATAKPVVDWVGDARTGAVLEVEGGWPIARQWAMAVMVGGLLWGEGVPTTYSRRAELKLIVRY